MDNPEDSLQKRITELEESFKIHLAQYNHLYKKCLDMALFISDLQSSADNNSTTVVPPPATSIATEQINPPALDNIKEEIGTYLKFMEQNTNKIISALKFLHHGQDQNYATIQNTIQEVACKTQGILKLLHQQATLPKGKFDPIKIIMDFVKNIQPEITGKNLTIEVVNNLSTPIQIYNDPAKFKKILSLLCLQTGASSNKKNIKIIASSAQDKNKFEACIEYYPTPGTTLQEFQSSIICENIKLKFQTCKELSEAMGGNIQLINCPSVGTKFIFSLNLQQKHAQNKQTDDTSDLINTAHSNSPVKQPQLRGHILVVDDCVEIQEMITNSLHQLGLSYSLAKNGNDAIEQAYMDNPDIILMDIQMPIMDGKQATKILRDGGYKKPILALTCNVMRNDILSYLNLGFDNYIAKPIDIQKFPCLIEQYLNQSKSEQCNINKCFENNIQNLTKSFIQRLPETMTELKQAQSAHDLPTVKHILYTIKISGTNFGLHAITEQVITLENNLKQDEDLLLIQNFTPLYRAIEHICGIPQAQQQKHNLP